MQYDTHVRLHIDPLIGTIKLADFAPADVARFRDALHAARSPALTAKIMTSLFSILAEAFSRCEVARNVIRDAASPSGKRHSRLRKRQERRLEVGVDIPSKEEINRLLETARGSRLRPLLITAIYTGLQASELRGLTWNDVELDKELVTVRQRADCRGTIGPPKSDAAKREVPLAPIVVNTLREWKLDCPRGALDLVFPNRVGKPEAHNSILVCKLHPLEDAAGVSRYGLHAFRHLPARSLSSSVLPRRGFRKSWVTPRSR
jgi:integrase